MFRTIKLKLCLATLIVCILGNFNSVTAQGNSELLPPPIPGELVLACAEAAEDGNIHIVRSSIRFSVETIDSAEEATNEKTDGSSEGSGEDSDDDEEGEEEEQITEMVRQTYTVQVPYTEQIVVDGKTVNVTRMRTETRTRTVPMTTIRGKSVKGSKPVSYKVTVPYTEQIVGSDGTVKSVIRSRTETRTVMVGQNEHLVKKLSPVIYSLDPAKLKYYTLDGESISAADAMSRFIERQPVVLSNKNEPLGEYYQQVLTPETVLVVDEDDVIAASLLKTEDNDSEDE